MAEQMLTRPRLREVALLAVLPAQPGMCFCTMSIGQWDTLLQAAYNAGFVLLELDDDERPIRAYQRANPEAN